MTIRPCDINPNLFISEEQQEILADMATGGAPITAIRTAIRDTAFLAMKRTKEFYDRQNALTSDTESIIFPV